VEVRRHGPAKTDAELAEVLARRVLAVDVSLLNAEARETWPGLLYAPIS
jgi:hypothetical protein